MSAVFPKALYWGLTLVRPLHKSFGIMHQSKREVERGGLDCHIYPVPWAEEGDLCFVPLPGIPAPR